MSDDWNVSPTALESRAETESLDELQHRRRVLLVELAPLKALHGPFGTWDAKRKALLEGLKVRHRMQLAIDGTKATEAMIDALAHADEQYERFLDESTGAKARYLVLDNEFTELAERIRSREIALLAYNSEVKLTR
jgi:hypothetical protein